MPSLGVDFAMTLFWQFGVGKRYSNIYNLPDLKSACTNFRGVAEDQSVVAFDSRSNPRNTWLR